MSAVDDFVAQKVLPEYRPIVARFRKLITNEYPELTESMRGGTEAYYGVPVYKLRTTAVTISPTKQGITFNFATGATFEDKYNLLEGLGKTTKNWRVKDLSSFNKTIARYYIDQSLEFAR